MNQKNSDLNTQHSRLKETLKDLYGVLSSEGQQKLQEKNERIQNLLVQLKNEVQRISEELNYDYDYKDYERKLLQSDEFIEKVKRRLLEEKPKLSAIREELVGMFQGMEEVMGRKFFREYLEDLVYEKIDKNELKKSSSLQLGAGELIVKWGKDKEKLKKDLLNAKDVDLEYTIPLDLGEEELRAIFENFQNIKSIVLGNNKLSELGEEKLKAIFENFQNVRSIYLRSTHLGNLGEEKLKTIFQNLQNVKRIDLVTNQLGNLGEEGLKAIFQNLQNVKIIDLVTNQLGNLGEEGLKAIFQNLQNIKRIDLGDNNLGELGEEELKAIFENFQNIKSIDLENNRFSEEQKEYIQSLLPDDVKIKFN